MNEYINREDALDAVLFALVGTGQQSKAITAIRELPTADVVAVVRCKDCKHYRAYEPPIEDFDGWCSANENEYDKEFYCQYGERRENGK